MSMVTDPPIAPVPFGRFPWTFRPYQNITPFTVRDGTTFIDEQEALKRWLRYTLVPHINTELSELGEDYKQASLALAEALVKFDADATEFVEQVAALKNDAALAQAAAEAASAKAEQWAAGTEKLQDAAVSTLIRKRDSETYRALKVYQTTLNVYDYGAIDVSVPGAIVGGAVPSSQTAIDALLADARSRIAFGDKINMEIPYGAISGDINLDMPFVNVIGAGTLLAVNGTGFIRFIGKATDGTPALRRFYGGVSGIGMRPHDAARSRAGGIVIQGAAFVVVEEVKFENLLTAILNDTYANVDNAFPEQQNKTVRIRMNDVINVDRFVHENRRAGVHWSANADYRIDLNIVRHAYISAFEITTDGSNIHDNVVFNVGYLSTDTYNRNRKQDIMIIGRASNFVNIYNNTLFEAGGSAIFLNAVQSATVRGNQAIWCGQLRQVAAIRVAVDAGVFCEGILIDGNYIDGCTQHGITVSGNGDASRVKITDSNQINLYGAHPTRRVWIGEGAHNPAISRVFVTDTIAKIPQINMTEHRTTRRGVLSVKGMHSLSRKQNHRDDYETIIDFDGSDLDETNDRRKTFAAGGTVGLGVIRLSGDNATAEYLAGEIIATFRDANGRMMRYKFTVEGGGINVTNVVKNGGLAGAPDFEFSVASAGTLTAKNIGVNAVAKVSVTIVARGACQISYSAADYAALPLVLAA